MAKRNSRKQTANQREYAKQVKRIKQAVRRAEKRGYIFDENIVPQTPKRITAKAIQKLKEITPQALYSQATYINTNTGEMLSGTEGRQLEKKESARKAKETRERNKRKQKKKDKEQEPYYPNGGDIIMTNVLDQFIERLSQPTPEVIANHWGKKYKRYQDAYEESKRSKATLLSITYRVIDEIGRDALGWRLEAQASEVSTLTDYVLYGSNSATIASACARLASIINGGPLSLQELEDISEQEEYGEDWELPE